MNDSTTSNNDSSPKKADRKDIKILIVEDEPDARSIFKTLLELNGGYTVEEAENGEIALERLAKKDIDLVLLDIVMPVMDGLEVLKTVRENPDNYGNPCMVMLTNLTSESAEDTSSKYQADGYLTKIDMEPDVLIKKIDGFLEGK